MNVESFQRIRDELARKLYEPHAATIILAKIEDATGVERSNLVSGLLCIFAIYLVFGNFAEFVCNTIGFLYPAYMSIYAIESASKDDDTQWLMYWVVFALFSVVESAVGRIVRWFPIYWLCKCAVLLYLHMPITKGAQQIYVGHVRPFVFGTNGD